MVRRLICLQARRYHAGPRWTSMWSVCTALPRRRARGYVFASLRSGAALSREAICAHGAPAAKRAAATFASSRWLQDRPQTRPVIHNHGAAAEPEQAILEE